MKKLIFIFFIFIFFSSAHSQNITILYTNNVDGYLKACNCPGNVFGGLIYFDDVISKIRAKNENVLFLDSGDLFTIKNFRLQAEFAVNFYNLLGLDALNIGDQELWFGSKYILETKTKAQFKLLSANIVQNDSLIFLPYLQKNIAGVNVAIIGILNEEIFEKSQKYHPTDFEIKNSLEVLKTTLEQVKPNSDVIVLLSHSGIERDKQIAKEFPDIDFIIGAHSEVVLEKPIKIKNIRIFQAGKYAHYLGVIQFDYKQGMLQNVNHQLIKMESIPITKRSADLYNEYSAASEELLDKMYKQLTSQKNSVQIAPTPQKCASCHFDEYDHWWRTPHAYAWSTIEKDGRTTDISCITCHTTLFGEEGGFVNLLRTPDLINVTCVSCHRDYKGHPDEHSQMERVSANTCINCHDKPNSPRFNFEIYRKSVEHKLRYYTIKPNDWLSKIARKYYHNIHAWQPIYQANRYEIKNPDLIFPNQKIVVPVRPLEFEEFVRVKKLKGLD